MRPTLRGAAWRDEQNARALARLNKSLPAIFPGTVLAHAMSRRFTPPTPRLAVDSYWRNHPVRADRLARALAARSGAPAGWTWRVSQGALRSPPAPYREKPFARGPGHCCVCAQPVFRFGWHVDLWADGKPNANARWHTCCVVAWKLWTAPRSHLRALRKVQGRLCPATGKRLLKTGEVDHRVALHRVWREHRDKPWPELLAFWGVPNLQVINRDAHASKTWLEARVRAEAARAPAPAAG